MRSAFSLEEHSSFSECTAYDVGLGPSKDFSHSDAVAHCGKVTLCVCESHPLVKKLWGAGASPKGMNRREDCDKG